MVDNTAIETGCVPRATGCAIDAASLMKPNWFDITDFGASPDASPMKNAESINAAILAAAAQGGGTVNVPAGRFCTYTVALHSDVNLHIDAGAELASGRYDIHDGICDVWGDSFRQSGQGGNSFEPEVNPYVGLQDHAHSYLRNCLIWGDRVSNVMIYGGGLIDGSYIDDEGVRRPALAYSDPQDPEYRDNRGYTTEWFGNKGIALFNCEHIVLQGFRMLMGGHFAIIATGTNDLLVEGLVVDTNRDGIDIDSVADCTVRGCVFNTLHDDAIVIKSSYGAQRFADSHNVLVENCQVSGYDTGSVLAGNPTVDHVECHPRMGGIGRVKLGTEATGGYDLVTIRNIRFLHCAGLALEAVDGSDMTNIVAENLDMVDPTSGPLFIRVSDRGRYPVTGHGDGMKVSPQNDVRLDEARWVLPNGKGLDCYPAKRYIPSYNWVEAEFDGGRTQRVVDQQSPVRINQANFAEIDGKRHPYVYDETAGRYVPDTGIELSEHDVLGLGNAVGAERIAQCRDVEITNVKVRGADPRYAMIIAGCVDGRVSNLKLSNFDVTYRGGLGLDDAVEQRVLSTDWDYRNLDNDWGDVRINWFVQQHGDGALPRVRFDQETRQWVADPYNVQEGSRDYPEPVEFGITPAYGLYMRHVDDVKVDNIRLGWQVEDRRPAIVLDDVHGAAFGHVEAQTDGVAPQFVTVEHHYKRRTCFEFVPDEPYFTTGVSEVCIPAEASVEHVVIDAPEVGTPPDRLYELPTLPSVDNGYRYAVPNERKSLPRTVNLPYFLTRFEPKVKVGERFVCQVELRDPLNEAERWEVCVEGVPDGARFDGCAVQWNPSSDDRGVHAIVFTAMSQGLSVEKAVTIMVVD